MLDPPLEAGAVKETVACALPADAETAVGTPGTVYGMDETMFEGVEVPTPF